MRTTLTLEPDVARQLKAYAHARRLTFKDAVNELLRAGLSPGRTPSATPFVVTPHGGGFVPGIDPVRLKDALAEDDAQRFLAAGAP